MNTWVTQVRHEDGIWHDAIVGTRFSLAIRLHNEHPATPKRFLRNGKVLRLGTDTDQLDLLNEED